MKKEEKRRKKKKKKMKNIRKKKEEKKKEEENGGLNYLKVFINDQINNFCAGVLLNKLFANKHI